MSNTNKKIQILDFEKPIYEMQDKIEELKKTSSTTQINYDSGIESLEEQTRMYKKELYEKLEPYQKLQIARHPQRPNFYDYVQFMCENFIELHGDRHGCDDKAIAGGLAKIGGKNVMLIGTVKGKSTKENLECNFGMPQPQGYRKALRLFEHANRFDLPIITLIDTMGAYPGMLAEEAGQGEAIAFNLKEMAKLSVPVIAVVTGEGCSGGALGLAVANKVMVLEHAYYTVISPEGCASILWKDAAMAKVATDALKITGEDLLKLGIIDEVVKEPIGGAHYSAQEMSDNLKTALLNSLKEFEKMTSEELREHRYSKFRAMGVFAQ
ncbi:MAG: acetyl-CoA carboxylase carboxyltransferase subunit alpha [Candidatus Gastranaerophilales bacterium]|nr:acetyl-CoA carboxylase carboxyltransferase subunit alpha [Candidatus Gastranaerophilales bacterium]